MDIQKIFTNYKNGGNNYILKADSRNRWCGFNKNVIDQLRRKYDTNFNLILWGTQSDSDFYCIPYNSVEHLFVPEHMTKGKIAEQGNERWTAIIESHKFKMHANSMYSVNIENFYGNRELSPINGFDEIEKVEEEMNAYDWKLEIKTWVQGRKNIQEFEKDLIDFFSNVFSSTAIPERAYFGSTKSSINLLVGGIYLGSYIHSGNDKGIWLLLDKQLAPIVGAEYKPVQSTKKTETLLTWFHSDNLGTLKIINKNKDFWTSYRFASQKVIHTPKGYSTRADYIENKKLLSSFWEQQISPIDEQFINEKLTNEIKSSKLLTRKERSERLKSANKKPDRIQSQTSTFIRNSDVIAETLEKANGVCEICRKPAPFIRDSDNSPFLEVHHKKPLSQDGEDTVENAIALCPNCHRHSHFGKKTFRLNI